jgi:hypothetical protein
MKTVKISAAKKVKIKTKHPGLLKVPEGKSVWTMPIKHFVNLAKRIGRAKVSRALTNLKVWNKNKRTENATKIKDFVERALNAIDRAFATAYVQASVTDSIQKAMVTAAPIRVRYVTSKSKVEEYQDQQYDNEEAWNLYPGFVAPAYVAYVPGYDDAQDVAIDEMVGYISVFPKKPTAALPNVLAIKADYKKSPKADPANVCSFLALEVFRKEMRGRTDLNGIEYQAPRRMAIEIESLAKKYKVPILKR